MTVRITQDGLTTVVTIDRPHVRNAVDRATAQALADAFRGFEADPGSKVAVLTGAGSTFCAGADLRAIAGGEPNRLQPDGDAPMGPSRMVLSKPVIAAISGYAVAGDSSSPVGRTCALSSPMPCSVSSAAGWEYR